jgi:acetyl-CoA acetyltransferase
LRGKPGFCLRPIVSEHRREGANVEAVDIVGIGTHPFGRFPGASLKDLARIAIVGALIDSGLGVRDIDAVFAANAMAGLLQGQEQVRGQSVLREVGIERVPVVNIENACASGSTALHQARLAVAVGAAEIALVVGFEKMFVNDLDRSLGALESAADLDVVGGLGLQFTAVYAVRVQKMVAAGRVLPRHLVDVTVKSHACGALNPVAQHRRRLTAEEVAAARMIADPLTLFMCSSICDGAAAVIVARPGRVQVPVPVRIRSARLASGFTRMSDSEPSIAAICSRQAYEEAGIGPEDVDVVELHDAVAPAELLYYEDLGLCAEGESGSLLDSGASGIGGKIPVNPSGGLTSRGHATGATGLAQVVELVQQLRGTAGARQVTDPRIGLAQNSGGWYDGESAACVVHVLERTLPWS